ncbi:nucleotidyltransferase domain-containing protein [Catellatospora vulcania]|uniref:nucleotidyltransferase domain-containing protein n=1 Tax=Catellatospora vulcania TaxID=1460450 RepID=UPI0018AFB087|nr:nucleotidyltransferase domain-containing protein [Catellatospora vulcania]
MTAAHVRALDERVRGLVTGLFVTGSVPLGDYWPGRSDIDFVAVMDRAPTTGELGRLAKAHLSLPEDGPVYDGIYLTRAQLAAPPADGDTAPQILAGDFQPAKAGGQLNPVTWLELARHGLPILGERPEVALDEGVLRRWLLDNLSGYWADFAKRATPQFAALPPDMAIPPDPVLWAVTGPGRLHFTLATGEVTTKTGGARHTAEVLPQWAELCARVERSRAGDDVSFTAADGLASMRLVTDVVTDARARWTA